MRRKHTKSENVEHSTIHTVRAHNQRSTAVSYRGHRCSSHFSTDWGHAKCMRMRFCAFVRVCPPYTIKSFWWVPQGTTISTKKQKLASPPIMISPPQKRVRWSFLNQDGKRGGGKWQGGKEKRKWGECCHLWKWVNSSYSAGHQY